MADDTASTSTPGLLVFGDDGSSAAEAAWAWVQAQPWPGWAARVLTAAPPEVPAVVAPDQIDPTPWISPHPRAAGGCGLGPVEALHAPVDPRLLLGAVHDADLMVVSAHQPGRRHPITLGSTAEWLLHHPPSPLVIVRGSARINRVLVAADGSPDALAAVRALARLPLASSAEVVVLGVADGRTDAEAATAEAVAVLAGQGVAARVVGAAGLPTAAILEATDELAPDLVVLGTRGLTGWKRIRLGSTAGAVVRSVGCSALVACHDADA